MTRRKLLRLVDIAELVGVSRQRVSVLRRRADFPIRSTGMGMATFGQLAMFAPGLGPTMAALGVGAAPGFLRGD